MTYIDQITSFSNYVDSSLVISQNDKYGVLDLYGKTIIPFTYDFLSDISEGLFAACSNGKWGYIDIDNNIVIPFEYERCNTFREGLALVQKDLQYAYIDKQNKIKIPFKYGFGGNFSEGLARIYTVEDNRFGFIDKNQNLVIPAQYEHALSFNKGVAIVSNDYDAWGAIDKDGKEIIPCRYYSISIYKEFFLLTRSDYSSFDFFDIKGNKIENPQEYFDNLPSKAKSIDLLDQILADKILRDIKDQINLEHYQIVSELNQDRYLVNCLHQKALVIDQFGKILFQLDIKEETEKTSVDQVKSDNLDKVGDENDKLTEVQLEIMDDYLENRDELNFLLSKILNFPTSEIEDLQTLWDEQERLNAIDCIAENQEFLKTYKRNFRLKKRREEIEHIGKKIIKLYLTQDPKIGIYAYEEHERRYNRNVIFVIVSVVIIILLSIFL